MPELVSLPPDLRQRLLGDLGNLELRQKYLATRLPAWKAADLRLAHDRLLLARTLRGTAGLAVVGAAGGALGTWWLGASPALPVLVGIGSVLTAAATFAMLGAAGFVVLPEVVGEEKPRRSGQGTGLVLAQFVDAMTEAGCGALWGAICGLLIGVLTAAAHACIVFADAPTAGAVGGALLGIALGAIALAAHQPSGLVRYWADLGPLHLPAYLASRSLARRWYWKR